MSFDRNKVKSIIKKNLIPKLELLGFKKGRKGTGVYRIRGDFIDVLTLQIGRSPGSLYLHYFTNLLADPFGDLLHGNPFGFRLGGMEVGDRPWLAENEEELHEILDLIYQAACSVAIPFFDTLNNLDDYLKVLTDYRRAYRCSLPIIHILKGEDDTALRICNELKKENLESEWFDVEKKEGDREWMEKTEELIASLSAGNALDLVNSWKLAHEEGLRSGKMH